MAFKNYIFKKLGRSIFFLTGLFIVIPIVFAFLFSLNEYKHILSEEIHSNAMTRIQGIDEEIEELLHGAVKVSNYLMNDKRLVEMLSSNDYSMVDKTKTIDELISNIVDSNLSLNSLRITIIDNEGNFFTNWSLNFNDYDYLLNEDVVQEALAKEGYLSWRLFENNFEVGRDDRLILLAREIIDLRSTNDKLGVMLVSFSDDEVLKILNKYISDDETAILRLDNQRVLETSKSLEAIEIEFEHQENIRIHGMNYLSTTMFVSDNHWIRDMNDMSVSIVSPFNHANNSLVTFTNKLKLLLFILCLILLGLIIVFIRWIVKPIEDLTDVIETFEVNASEALPQLKRKDEIGLLYSQFNSMHVKLKHYIDKSNDETKIKEKYKFEALKAQVNPHFLFNSLNMIRCMAIINKNKDIVHSIESLGNLLKYNLDNQSEIVTLNEEINQLKSYAFIQNMRFNDKFAIVYHIETALFDAMVMKFILQPIVENAIIHGFKSKDKMYEINIFVSVEEEFLWIDVTDNGEGIEQNKLDAIKANLQQSELNDPSKGGIGLRNIDQRIKIFFGKAYGLSIASELGVGTKITLQLPLVDRWGKQDENIDC